MNQPAHNPRAAGFQPASPPGPLRSAIYTGTVRHRRTSPSHTLHFPLYMAYLDLAELDTVLSLTRWWGRSALSPARFVETDYLQHRGTHSLDLAVRRTVADKLGRTPAGPVRMLTHLRQFGYIFNPVTFYYCFTPDEKLDAVVAQITNTPWKERHAYVLDCARPSKASDRWHRWAFDKAFHVSPFMPMDLGYDWTFTTPRAEVGSPLTVHMTLHPHADRASKSFDATLHLTRDEMTPQAMRGAVCRFPFLTARVITSIHLNALKLWLKKATVYAHPGPPDPNRARQEADPAPRTHTPPSPSPSTP